MTTTQLIIAVAAVAALIAVLAVRGGPRVTQIDRTVRKEKDSDDA